jgi:GAF domain-containing protein
MSSDSQQPNGPARTASAEQLATERLLRAAVESSREMLAADLEAGLSGALRALGEGTGLDRVYAMRYDHAARAGFFVAEHFSPSLASVTEAISAGPYGYAEHEEVWRPLMAGEVYTSLVAAKTGPTAELNRAAGVKSDLLVPVFVGGVFWGALGFDDCTTERVYCEAEIQVLRAAAAALAAAIKHKEAVRAALAEREARAAELADLNRELERSNRLLAASAQAGALLSAREDFDVAAVEAIGLVADAAEFDRAVLIEHLDAHGNPGTEFWRVTHEWHRPGVAAQSGSAVGGGPFSDAPKFVADLLLSPTTVEFATSEIEDEVFRRVQEKLGARLLVAGNIVIDGFSWGAFCCDDCTTERRRTAEEKGVIADAARAVGQAVYRRRLESRAEALKRQIDAEREQAASDRMVELANANEALRRSTANLASLADLSAFHESLLLSAAEITGARLAEVFTYDDRTRALKMTSAVREGKVVAIGEDPTMELWRHDLPEQLTRAWIARVGDKDFSVIEIALLPEESRKRPNVVWHVAEGHQLIIDVPLSVGGGWWGCSAYALLRQYGRERLRCSRCGCWRSRRHWRSSWGGSRRAGGRRRCRPSEIASRETCTTPWRRGSRVCSPSSVRWKGPWSQAASAFPSVISNAPGNSPALVWPRRAAAFTPCAPRRAPRRWPRA